MPKASRNNRAGKPAKAGRSGSRFFHTGAEARNRSSEELEKAKSRKTGGKRQPFRFYVPVDDSKHGIILDEEPSFFMYEHKLQDPTTGKWDKLIPCIMEHENCPACEASGQEGVYMMFLSILDLSEYEDRKGNVHEFSRKLLAVKPRQHSKFLRKFDREGTLRGAKFEFARDDPMGSSIGNDIEFIEFVDEDELENDYWVVQVDKDGKEVEVNLAEPFNYEEIFEEPTKELVERLIGMKSSNAGSRESNRKMLDEDDEEEGGTDGWEDDDEGAPWEDSGRGSSRSRNTRRSTATRRGRRADPEVEEEEEEDEPEPKRPSKTRTRPVRGTRRNARDEEEEPPKAARRTRMTRARR